MSKENRNKQQESVPVVTEAEQREQVLDKMAEAYDYLQQDSCATSRGIYESALRAAQVWDAFCHRESLYESDEDDPDGLAAKADELSYAIHALIDEKFSETPSVSIFLALMRRAAYSAEHIETCDVCREAINLGNIPHAAIG